MTHQLRILGHYLRGRYGRRFADRKRLERWQDIQVQRHLRWVLPRSAFYREYYQGRSLADWPTFPTLDKARMMANFDTLNTAGIKQTEAFAVATQAEAQRDFAPTLAGLTVGLSSGTSGTRGLFLVSPQEQQRWAGNILAKVLPGTLLRRHRIAFFFRANSNLYNSANGGTVRVQFFDLLKPLAEHTAALRDFAPTMLIAPPHMLKLLAQSQAFSSARLRPRKIVSVAEVLDPQDESYLTACFGQKIHQVYQATEGFIAVTCAHGTLHLNEDLMVVQKEYLDESLGKFVPIITDFSRTTQPIIRYRLNDILTLRQTPCPCGSQFTALAQIEGRADDLLYFLGHDGQTRVRVFPDFISRCLLAPGPGLEEYRVTQTMPGELTVQLQFGPELGALRQDALRQELVQRLQALADKLSARPPRISFGPYTPPEPGRKLKRIQQLGKEPA